MQFLSNILQGQTGHILVRLIRGTDRSMGWQWFSSLSLHEIGEFTSPFSPLFPFNVYYSVLTREVPRDSKEFVKGGAVVWCDLDYKEWVSTSEVPMPSCIVSSGHGHHLYWCLTSSQLAEDIESINRGLAQKLDGDGAACNRSRLLRLPFTYNVKTRPFVPVEIVEANWVRHDAEDFEQLKVVPPPSGLALSELEEQPGLSSLSVNLKYFFKYGYPPGEDRSRVDFKVVHELVDRGATLEDVKSYFINDANHLASDTRIGLAGKVNGLLYRKEDPERYLELTYYNVMKKRGYVNV